MRDKFLEIALSQIGIKEIAGEQDNPEILKYFDILGFDGNWVKDETSWCSAVHNWIAIKSGVAHTGALNARSWLDVGNALLEPFLGCTVVFWRGYHENETISGSDLKKGHVGTFIKERDGLIYCLGGNQSNSFKISSYKASKVLGYRSLI